MTLKRGVQNFNDEAAARSPGGGGRIGAHDGPSWMHAARLDAVMAAVRVAAPRRVADLGCGEGDLLTRLRALSGLDRLIGVDPCPVALNRLRARLDAPAARGAAEAGTVETGVAESGRPVLDITLLAASLTDPAVRRLAVDCAVLVETIEHIDPDRLSGVERAVFADLRPATAIITTPNADFNPLLGVPPHRFRHPDHRFEWGRAKFQHWTTGVAARHGYTVTHQDLAGHHATLGGASQMAMFARTA